MDVDLGHFITCTRETNHTALMIDIFNTIRISCNELTLADLVVIKMNDYGADKSPISGALTSFLYVLPS